MMLTHVCARPRATLALLLCSALLLQPAHAADPADTPVSPPVATVNGEVITEGALQVMLGTILAKTRPSRRSDIDDAQAQAREVLIADLAMAQRALQLGLDKDPGVAGVLAYQRAGTLSRAYQREMLRRNPIGAEMIEQEYQRALIDGKVNEFHVAHIVVSQRSRAYELIDQLRKGDRFDEVARIYSLDPKGAANGGDLGWMRIEALDEYQFVDAVRGLQPNAYTPEPVKGKNGWHIIKLLEAPRPAEVQPDYATLPPDVREKLKLRATQREIARLEGDAVKNASVSRAPDMRVFGAVGDPNVPVPTGNSPAGNAPADTAPKP